MRIRILYGISILVFATGVTATAASPREQVRADAEETARLLAKLLEAGRLVIEHNQPLIDDPHRGDKGFTADVFEQQLREEFRKKTDLDLAAISHKSSIFTVPRLARELLPALIEASKEVVNDAQLVINQRGISRTLLQTVSCTSETDRTSTT